MLKAAIEPGKARLSLLGKNMNIQALAGLDEAGASKISVYAAALEVVDTGEVIQLLYNPESKEYSRQAYYAEAPVAASSVSAQRYLRASGRKLELPQLFLDSRDAGKTLRSLIERIESLLLPADDGSAPSAVFFVWGSERFGPAVLESLSWEESSWLGGEPVTARMSVALTEIPAAEPPVSGATESGNTGLTERQQEEGKSAGQVYIERNGAIFSPDVRASLAGGTLKMLSTAEGVISASGALIETDQIIGRWDGIDFIPDEGDK